MKQSNWSTKQNFNKKVCVIQKNVLSLSQQNEGKNQQKNLTNKNLQIKKSFLPL